jgi:protein AATF/BFR2
VYRYVKGAAVRRQNAVWERALQTRIVLQRTVNAAAKLPTPAYAAALKEQNKDVAPAMAHFAGAARGALSALLQLQAALIDGNPAIAAAAADVTAVDEVNGVGGKKRKKSAAAAAAVSGMELLASPAAAVWAAVDSMFGRYAAFRNVSSDRWHRKVGRCTSCIHSTHSLKAPGFNH